MFRKKSKIFRTPLGDDRISLMNLDYIALVQLEKTEIRFFYAQELMVALKCENEQEAKKVFENIEQMLRA
jgi:hypothetical protein